MNHIKKNPLDIIREIFKAIAGFLARLFQKGVLNLHLSLIFIIVLSLLLFVERLEAQEYEKSIEIGLSSSYHFSSGNFKKKLKRKLTKDGGLINNSPDVTLIFGKSEENKFKTINGVTTFDCLDQFAIGSYFNQGWQSDNQKLRVGYLAGFYLIQTKEWKKRKLGKRSRADLTKEIGIIPLVGGTVEKTLYKKDSFGVNFKSFLSYPMSHFSINIGWDF